VTVLATAAAAQWEQDGQDVQEVRPNAYGLRVNADQFGRSHAYRLEDGSKLEPIFQDRVRRNAYGLGACMLTSSGGRFKTQPVRQSDGALVVAG
jgi:hypothetical protein